jgi:pilus assembly protein CpaB
MRLKSLLLIVVALVVAGFTAYMVRNWLEAERAAALRAMQNKPAPAIAATQVLVAKSNLPVGTFLRPEHLRWQAWPEASLSPAYVVQGKKQLEDYVGSVVRVPVAAGEPITDGRVVSPGNSGFLAAVLKPGYRAVSVPVTVTSGISGFVFPGDHVDLILTHSVPGEVEGIERRAGVTVLRDIRVLALDQKLDMKPGEAAVARTATIEVTPKQSEMVAVLVEMGKLSLSLRSLAREEAVPPDEAEGNPDAIHQVDLKQPESIKLKPEQPAGKTFTLDTEVSGLMSVRRVTVIRGGASEDVRVSR